MGLQDLDEGPGPGGSRLRLCRWRVFLGAEGALGSRLRRFERPLTKLLPFVFSSPARPPLNSSVDLGEKVQNLIRNSWDGGIKQRIEAVAGRALGLKVGVTCRGDARGCQLLVWGPMQSLCTVASNHHPGVGAVRGSEMRFSRV